MAIGGHIVDAVLRSMLIPGIFAVISLAVPARRCTLGFATGSLWVLLGLPILPIVGAFGDGYGLRVGHPAARPGVPGRRRILLASARRLR